MFHTTIRLPDELRDRLDAHMIRTGSTLNQTIAIALDHYLYIQERDEENRRLRRNTTDDPDT